MFIRYLKTLKNGFSMVFALTIFITMTLLTSVSVFLITSENKNIKSNRLNVAIDYASKTAEKLADLHLEKYIDVKMGSYMTTFNGNIASPIITNPTNFFSELYSNTPISYTLNGVTKTYTPNIFKNTATLNDKIYQVSSIYDQNTKSFIKKEIENKNSDNVVSYKYLFCNDSNKDMICSDNEKNNSFFIKTQEISTGSEKYQKYSYQVKYTIYVFNSSQTPLDSDSPSLYKSKVNNILSSSFYKKITKTLTYNFSYKAKTLAANSLLTNKHLTATNGEIWFTSSTNFDGPVHTNSANGSMFRFVGDGPSYKSATFKDKITSVGTNIKWYNTNKTTSPPLSNLNPSETKDKPVFEKDYQRNVQPIPLPSNSFNQERAALTNNSENSSQMTNSEKRQELGLTVNTSPVPNGVYLPKNGTSLKGGIYVKGNASISLSVNNGKQVYRITDASGNVSKIEVDYTNNKTSMCSGTNCVPTSSQIYNGIPNGALYVDGKVTSLSGPARVPSNSNDPNTAAPAIASKTKLTVFANNSVEITGDIKYSDNPLGPDGIYNTADDNQTAENTFGVFTSNDNIVIGSTSPKNITIHGPLMTSSSNSVVTVENYNSRADSGVVNLLGGIISDAYGAFGTFSGSSRTGYGRNFIYDRRLENNPPPFFPTSSTLEPEKPSSSGEIINEEKKGN